MKKIILGFTIFLAVFLGGCQTNAQSNLSEADQALVWQGERPKNFGIFDYTNLSGTTEAEEILQEKFQVELSDFYPQVLKKIEGETFIETPSEPLKYYHVIAAENQLTYQVNQQLESEDSWLGQIDVNFIYQWNQETKVARLQDQNILYQVNPQKSAELFAVLPNLIEQYGQLMGLTNLEEAIGDFLADYSTVNPSGGQEVVMIANNQDDSEDATDNQESLVKAVQAYYNTEGTLTELYFRINDLRSE